jgi:hypothetical protein
LQLLTIPGKSSGGARERAQCSERCASLVAAMQANLSILYCQCECQCEPPQHQHNRQLKAVLERNGAIYWPQVAPRLLDIAVALAPLTLPAYVVLEIIDWLPLIRLVNHKKKIDLIISVTRAFQQSRAFALRLQH